MMRKLRNPKSASRTPIATSLLSTINCKRILNDRGLPVPGTVHETPEPFQTVAGIKNSRVCTQAMPLMFTPTMLFPLLRRSSQAGRT